MRETVEVPEGDAERPLSRSSLERKFMNFAVPVVGKAGAERVMSAVDGLEELKDVRELTRALRGSGKQNPATAMKMPMSVVGTFRTWPDVRLLSVERSEADVDLSSNGWV